MKKAAITMATIILVIALAASSFALSWGRGAHRGPAYACDISNLIKKLNLTSEQATSIRALRDAHLKEIKPLQDKMFSKRGDLRLLWLEVNPDQKKIISMHKEMRSIRDQLEDKMVNFKLEVFKLLTPEQQNILKSSRRGLGFGPGSFCDNEDFQPRPGFMDRHGRGMRGNW